MHIRVAHLICYLHYVTIVDDVYDVTSVRHVTSETLSKVSTTEYQYLAIFLLQDVDQFFYQLGFSASFVFSIQ